MIELAYTAANPEAVVVKLADTPVAVSAVLCPEWKFLDSADFATSVFANVNLANMAETRLGSNPLAECILSTNRRPITRPQLSP